MDWTAIAASVVSGVLGIGAVAAFMAKYLPQVSKYAMIAKDAVETLSDVADGLKDGKLEQAEIDKIKVDIVRFRGDLKA